MCMKPFGSISYIVISFIEITETNLDYNQGKSVFAHCKDPKRLPRAKNLNATKSWSLRLVVIVEVRLGWCVKTFSISSMINLWRPSHDFVSRHMSPTAQAYPFELWAFTAIYIGISFTEICAQPWEHQRLTKSKYFNLIDFWMLELISFVRVKLGWCVKGFVISLITTFWHPFNKFVSS